MDDIIPTEPFAFEYDQGVNSPSGWDRQSTDDDDLLTREDAWEQYVETCMSKLRSLPTGQVINVKVEDVFTVENARYIVKARQKKYFEIFPWFLCPRKKNFRFRESLKAGTINLVVDAVNFFWNQALDETDLICIETFFRSPPTRCLSSIVSLKQEVDAKRVQLRAATHIRAKIEDHDDRLARLEVQLLSMGNPDERQPLKKQRSLAVENANEGEANVKSVLHMNEFRISSLESSLSQSLPEDCSMAAPVSPVDDCVNSYLRSNLSEQILWSLGEIRFKSLEVHSLTNDPIIFSNAVDIGELMSAQSHLECVIRILSKHKKNPDS